MSPLLRAWGPWGPWATWLCIVGLVLTVGGHVWNVATTVPGTGANIVQGVVTFLGLLCLFFAFATGVLRARNKHEEES